MTKKMLIKLILRWIYYITTMVVIYNVLFKSAAIPYLHYYIPTIIVFCVLDISGYILTKTPEKPKWKNKRSLFNIPVQRYILLPSNTTPNECASDVDAILIQDIIKNNDDPLQAITIKEVPAVKQYIKEYGYVIFKELPEDVQYIIQAVWYISPEAYDRAVAVYHLRDFYISDDYISDIDYV